MPAIGFALVTWKWREAEHQREQAVTARGEAVQQKQQAQQAE